MGFGVADEGGDVVIGEKGVGEDFRSRKAVYGQQWFTLGVLRTYGRESMPWHE